MFAAASAQRMGAYRFCCSASVRSCADAMRRTKAASPFLPSLSFVHNWQRRRLTNGPSNPLDRFREYSPLRVGVKQEVLVVGDPVSGSGAAEPLSNRGRGRRKADGEAHPGPDRWAKNVAHLLKGPEHETIRLYSSHSVWQNKATFEAWTRRKQSVLPIGKPARTSRSTSTIRSSKASRSARRCVAGNRSFFAAGQAPYTNSTSE